MDALIQQYNLVPHPEGGWYRETYRAARTLPGTGRSTCTAILYLLGDGLRSRLHRIDADELWHFHRGDSLHLVQLVARGPARIHELSPEHPQVVIPAGTWFGAMPAPGSRWTLCGCTVSPGFEFSGFELGDTARLLAEFPQAEKQIRAVQAG
ncbi:MAG TPA: cupin domain-containing protein [Myxococcaceae bacterium]|nr:cupin domain-containing protein [Myxococcaceae bacterium]